MKSLNAIAVAAFLTATSARFPAADACPGKDKKAAMVTKVSVDEAAKLHQAGKVIMVDANNDETRKDIGYVPGARLLSSYDTFTDKELNASKDDTLVFYCYNTACSAAPRAAEVASKRGYKTKVMDAGITGWKKAGHKVSKLSTTNS